MSNVYLPGKVLWTPAEDLKLMAFVDEFGIKHGIWYCMFKRKIF
jgi:hypothetical protein